MRLHVLATGSKGNCYALQDGGATLLLDAGITAAKILNGLGGSKSIIGCLVTHEHKDHCKAVEEFWRRGITAYGSIETARAIPYLRTSTGAHRIGQFLCLPFTVDHVNTDGTDCPNVGWLITNTDTKERMLYATDMCSMHNTFPNINYWLIECNYMDELLAGSHPAMIDRLPKSHMSLKKLVEVFAANDLTPCKQIVLCHASHERLDPEVAKKTVHEATGKPVVVAAAGMKIPLELEPY